MKLTNRLSKQCGKRPNGSHARPAAATRFIQVCFRPKQAPANTSAGSPTIEDLAIPAWRSSMRRLCMKLAHREAARCRTRRVNSQSAFFSGGRRAQLQAVCAFDVRGTPCRSCSCCTAAQNPDDFALGTRANQWAESKGWLVVYPEQIQRANAHRCWNWFRPSDRKQAAQGQRSSPASSGRSSTNIRSTRRVYVAGLSAGGAMAAIMAHEYPELFAAVAVHSGLPVGAASDQRC